jgi:alpha-L-fucosidase-like protein
MRWWPEARFGMFIHWGLYAQPAGEWKGVRQRGALVLQHNLALHARDKHFDHLPQLVRA